MGLSQQKISVHYMQNRKNARIILYICVIHIADNSNNTNNDNDY